MEISSINSSLVESLSAISEISSDTDESSFTDLLTEMMSDATEAEQAVEEANTDLLTGETDDLHTALIEAEKAELQLSLALQVRNKVVDAYNEVMRMQL